MNIYIHIYEFIIFINLFTLYAVTIYKSLKPTFKYKIQGKCKS